MVKPHFFSGFVLGTFLKTCQTSVGRRITC
jgi:hypothetical protein